MPGSREPAGGRGTLAIGLLSSRDCGLLAARLGARLASSGCPILTSLASQSPSLYPATIRSKSSEVETPRVLLVGMKRPIVAKGWQPTHQNEVHCQTYGFHVLVDVVAAVASFIWIIVMSHVINFVLVNKCLINDPWSFRNDFIYPTAVSDRLATLGMSHDGPRFVFTAELIRADAYQQVH